MDRRGARTRCWPASGRSASWRKRSPRSMPGSRPCSRRRRRSRLLALEQSIQASETARVAGEKDLEQAGREIERVARHAETVRVETAQIEAEYRNAVELLGLLEQRIAAAREAEAGRESAMG